VSTVVAGSGACQLLTEMGVDLRSSSEGRLDLRACDLGITEENRLGNIGTGFPAPQRIA
jgi:hypothetical protein